MAQAEPDSTGSITLDELLALNDEIAALTRAGVPLEQGLAALGSDMPGRLGAIATMLAERAGRGEPLLQVLAEQSGRLPPVYRAVVEAGLRAGRLPAALEALATSLRRLAETRRSILAASIYPLLVVVLACGLFAFFCRHTAPTLASALGYFGVSGRVLLATWASWGRWAGYWGTAVPLLIVILATVWWRQSRRAAVIGSQHASLLSWLPWVGKTLQWARTAAFCEVLALLVESRVPLTTALVLAAEACGDPRLLAAAKQLAERLQRGEMMGVGQASQPDANVGQAFQPDAESAKVRLESLTYGKPAVFPPLLNWMMAAGHRQGSLAAALKHAAETYQRRAQYQADLVRVLLPVVLTVAVGGSVTAFFALTLFLPYTSMLKTLAGI